MTKHKHEKLLMYAANNEDALFVCDTFKSPKPISYVDMYPDNDWEIMSDKKPALILYGTLSENFGFFNNKYNISSDTHKIIFPEYDITREGKIILLDKECQHNWHYEGHGHNYSCYKCSRCGEEKEE